MLMSAAPDNNLEEIFKENKIELIRVGRLIESGTYIEEKGKKNDFIKPDKDELWKFIEKYSE